MALYRYVKSNPNIYNLNDIFYSDEETVVVSTQPDTPVNYDPVPENLPVKAKKNIISLLKKKSLSVSQKIKKSKISLRLQINKPEFIRKPSFSVKSTGPKSKFTSFAPHLMIIMGFGMLAFVFYPIINWQIIHLSKAPENKLLKPTSDSLGKSVLAAGDGENSKLDLAGNWFPSYHPLNGNKNKIKDYKITIPKLGIENALVIYNSEELTKSLIGYQGTAIPGEYGNAVIFGHSVLPEFFNPKDYSTIFATLPELIPGDEVFAEVDNVKYKYVVYDFKTVDPSEISVLEQKYDNYYLSLITCVPPGLKWKRLVVKAKLEPID